MQINYWSELQSIMRRYGISLDEVCLVSSAVLAVCGIRGNRDIEFCLLPAARQRLLAENTELHIDKYSQVIKFSDKIECVRDIYALFGVDDMTLFSAGYSSLKAGIRGVNVELYIALKIMQNREKDRQDIQIIRSHPVAKDISWEVVEKYVAAAQASGYQSPCEDVAGYFHELLMQDREIYIFGMGHIARHVYKMAERENCCQRIKGFLTSGNSGMDSYKGKPVFLYGDVVNKETCTIIVAVVFNQMLQVRCLLQTAGFRHIVDGYCFWLA